MELHESPIRHVYYYPRATSRAYAEVSALEQFRETELLTRPAPREASVEVLQPAGSPDLCAIVVLADWSESELLEAVDLGTLGTSSDKVVVETHRASLIDFSLTGELRTAKKHWEFTCTDIYLGPSPLFKAWMRTK